MLKETSIFCLISLITFFFPVAARSSRVELPEAELQRLDKVMAASDLYMRDKTKRLDSLKTKFHQIKPSETHLKWKKAMTLSKEYLPIRADSAMRYAEVALRLAETTGHAQCELESKIALVNSFSVAGIFTRAKDIFVTLNPTEMTPDMRLQYWSAGRKLYGYMKIYVDGDRLFINEYSEKYMEYDDSLINNLPKSDKMRSFYIAERMVSEGKYQDARPLLENLMKSMPEESNLCAMAAFQLGIICKSEGDPTGYATMMIRAAISDIKGCVKDGLALPALADWLYQQGELNDAFRYINFALEDATTGNVRTRTIAIASLLPMIDEAYKEKINASRDELMIYFLLVAFLFVLSVALIIVLLRIVKKSRMATRQLAKTANIQESYLGHFIGMSSNYVSKLEALQKLVTRKIASGQSDELLRIIKTGKFADDQNEEFFKIFDAAFLHMYPGFINDINELLRPEESVELKKENELTPELRIYAFVRLGVEESTKIAQLLNYSVSTVYAYRNRMRNKAVNRDTFDKDVMTLSKKIQLE